MREINELRNVKLLLLKIINNENLKTNYLEIMRSCFTKI
jgi:hypothetical protein